MSALSGAADALLALLPVYGYSVLGLSVVASATGVPLPTSILLLAAGALSAEGVLDFLPTVAVALAAAVVGDCLAYTIGRLAGRPLIERAVPRLRLPAGWFAAAERAFGRWGGGAVWITRWLLTAAGPAVSVLAGTEAYGFRPYLVFVTAGEALWAGGYIGLGWLFGDSWDDLLSLLDNATWAAAALIAAVLIGLIARSQLRRSVRAA